MPTFTEDTGLRVSTPSSGSSAASSSVFPNTPAQGTLLVACVEYMTTGTITENSGTWTALAATQSGGSGGSAHCARQFAKIAGASEPTTVNFNGPANNWAISMTGFLGVESASIAAAQDVANAVLTASANPEVSPSVNPADGANRLVVSFPAARGAVTFSSHGYSENGGSSYSDTMTESTTTASNGRVAIAWIEIASTTTGNYLTRVNMSGSAAGAMGIGIYKPAAVVAVAPPPRPLVQRLPLLVR